MVIAFVDIEIVRELAYTATIGVTVMIITNKVLLPILLSYYKFSPERPASWPARRRRATGCGNGSVPSRRRALPGWRSPSAWCCSPSASRRRVTCTSATWARACRS